MLSKSKQDCLYRMRVRGRSQIVGLADTLGEFMCFIGEPKVAPPTPDHETPVDPTPGVWSTTHAGTPIAFHDVPIGRRFTTSWGEDFTRINTYHARSCFGGVQCFGPSTTVIR